MGEDVEARLLAADAVLDVGVALEVGTAADSEDSSDVEPHAVLVSKTIAASAVSERCFMVVLHLKLDAGVIPT